MSNYFLKLGTLDIIVKQGWTVNSCIVRISVMFRMYDTDKNGFLDQLEMDSIIDQMMTVADHMGWETNELRPVTADVSNSLSVLTPP